MPPFAKAALAVFFFTNYFQNAISLKVCNSFQDYTIFGSNANCFDDPDGERNVSEIIQSWNFIAEEYTLTTEDGYRILLVRAYQNITRQHPVLLAHGAYGNSLSFVYRKNSSLTHALIESGYEVWLINFRGTKYSKSHIRLQSTDLAFWDFSFHEWAIYDMRSAVNFIHERCKEKIIYLGYSQGTTTSYVYSSIFKKEAGNNLKGIISIAPVAYVDHLKSFPAKIHSFLPLLRLFVDVFLHGELLQVVTVAARFCNLNLLTMKFCYFVMFITGGFDVGQLDPVSTPLTFTRYQDTISVKVLSHYNQILSTKEFKHYDYGLVKNVKKYGQFNPPLYKFADIEVPVALFVGKNDYVATVRNADRIYSELNSKSRCGYNKIDYAKWTHFDFFTAKDVNYYLNDNLVKTIDSMANMQNSTCIR